MGCEGVISIQYPTRDERGEDAPNPEGKVYEPRLQAIEPVETDAQRTKRGFKWGYHTTITLTYEWVNFRLSLSLQAGNGPLYL